MEQCEKSLLYLSSNVMLGEFLSTGDDEYMKLLGLSENVAPLVYNSLLSTRNFAKIQIYSSKNFGVSKDLFKNDAEVSEEEWYIQTDSVKKTLWWYDENFFITRCVRDSVTEENLGVIRVDLKDDMIRQCMDVFATLPVQIEVGEEEKTYFIYQNSDKLSDIGYEETVLLGDSGIEVHYIIGGQYFSTFLHPRIIGSLIIVAVLLVLVWYLVDRSTKYLLRHLYRVIDGVKAVRDENFEIEGKAYYTNNPPAGAFRGFGVTQTCFCTETLLNEMADLVGISPWEIRYRNAIRPGGVLPNGQIVDDSTALVETLEAIRPYYDRAAAQGKPVGIACAMKNSGLGVGIPDWGRCRLLVESDGKVHIHAGASCMGQGLGTVLVQLVVSNAGLQREQVVYERSNTWIAPDSGDSSGSRQTLITGEATRRAAQKLRRALEGHTLQELAGQEFYGEYLAKTDPLGADVPHPVSHVAYGYATQMCVLDGDSGKISSMVAAHAVGKAINPLSCEGQIEGGVVMSMGYALREQYPIDENCRPTARFGTLGLFRSTEIPEIRSIVVEKPGLSVAEGAIGIGEITAIPGAPAIADAYFRLTGRRQYVLPLEDTPYSRKKK